MLSLFAASRFFFSLAFYARRDAREMRKKKNYFSQEGSCISLPLVALRWLLVTKVIIAHYSSTIRQKCKNGKNDNGILLFYSMIFSFFFFLLILVANYSDLCEISDSSMLKKEKRKE